jgi:hypothetical protein
LYCVITALHFELNRIFTILLKLSIFIFEVDFIDERRSSMADERRTISTKK